MTVLAHVVRVLAPGLVMLYVVYLVVFLTAAVALRGVAVLTVAPWLASRVVDAVQARHHHLT